MNDPVKAALTERTKVAKAELKPLKAEVARLELALKLAKWAVYRPEQEIDVLKQLRRYHQEHGTLNGLSVLRYADRSNWPPQESGTPEEILLALSREWRMYTDSNYRKGNPPQYANRPMPTLPTYIERMLTERVTPADAWLAQHLNEAAFTNS